MSRQLRWCQTDRTDALQQDGDHWVPRRDLSSRLPGSQAQFFSSLVRPSFFFSFASLIPRPRCRGQVSQKLKAEGHMKARCDGRGGQHDQSCDQSVFLA